MNVSTADKDDGTTTRAGIVAEICGRLSAGESVASIFRTPSPGMPSETTFWRWLDADEDLDRTYERATRRRGEKYAEEVVEIVDSAGSPLLDPDGKPYLDKDGRPIMVVDRVAVEHAKVRAEKRQWVAARMLPKRFGDRTILSGDADNPLAFVDQSAVAGKLLPELAAGGAPAAPGEPDAT